MAGCSTPRGEPVALRVLGVIGSRYVQPRSCGVFLRVCKMLALFVYVAVFSLCSLAVTKWRCSCSAFQLLQSTRFWRARVLGSGDPALKVSLPFPLSSPLVAAGNAPVFAAFQLQRCAGAPLRRREVFTAVILKRGVPSAFQEAECAAAPFCCKAIRQSFPKPAAASSASMHEAKGSAWRLLKQ